MHRHSSINKILAFLSLILYISCTDLSSNENAESKEDYELLIKLEGESNFWLRRHLVDYFVMVALGSEYGSDFKISRKWHSHMKVIVKGVHDPLLINELDKIINEINDLSQDGFRIERVGDDEESNFTIFLGGKREYNLLFPGASDLIEKNDGLFRLKMDDFVNKEGSLFVNSELNSFEVKKHLLREELTQSLGLGNDIEHYANSIFYQQPSRVTEYSTNDKEIIRLLYHPQMVAGLSEDSVRGILEGILGL
ncbi:MAG: DUF2927 domain-containing protein [Saprospiraceae bacterium]|nr:DUF2927 domain-containing protein [Saprospiraceae bacterium]